MQATATTNMVVGPAGVFLLDSKHLQGTVHLANGRPHLRRRLDPGEDRSLVDCRARRNASPAGCTTSSNSEPASRYGARHRRAVERLQPRPIRARQVHTRAWQAVAPVAASAGHQARPDERRALVGRRRSVGRQRANDGPLATPSSGFAPDHPTRSIGQQAAFAAQTPPYPALLGLSRRATPVRKALQSRPKPRPGGHLRHGWRAAS
jgi:hypothetical protein